MNTYNLIRQNKRSDKISYEEYKNAIIFAEEKPWEYNPHLTRKINSWIMQLREAAADKDMFGYEYTKDDLINEGYGYILGILEGKKQIL